MTCLKARDRGGLLYELHFLNNVGAFFFWAIQDISSKNKLKSAAFTAVKKRLFFVFQTQISNCKSVYRYFFMLFSLYPNTPVLHSRFSLLFTLFWRVLLRELLGKKVKNNPMFFSRSRMKAWILNCRESRFLPTHIYVISQLPQHECLPNNFFTAFIQISSIWLLQDHKLERMQSSAFHVFSCLCSLNHGFSVTPALHLSALDEQNAAIPGLFQSINAPFGPWLTVFSQQNLWIP